LESNVPKSVRAQIEEAITQAIGAGVSCDDIAKVLAPIACQRTVERAIRNVRAVGRARAKGATPQAQE
jgi:hypothetical protein